MKIKVKVRNIPDIKINSSIKVGDEVYCIPGFINTRYIQENSEDPKHGGSGYEVGHTFAVNMITNEGATLEEKIYWGAGNGRGVYGRAIRKVIDK